MELRQRLAATASATINKSYLTPVVLFRGLNEDGASLKVLSRWIRYALPGIYVHILEVGDRFDGYFTNMNRQTAAVCQVIENNPRLEHGFNVIGLSHGALLARAYIERCNKPQVRSYISFAGPQMGVFQLPAIHDEHADFVLQGAAYEEWSQEYLSPAQYFRHPMKPKLFKAESIFLADINNEREVKNATYKTNIEQLEAMVLVKFSKDTIVMPRETAWFGYYKPFSVDIEVGMEEQDVFKQDFLGLRSLLRSGSLHRILVDGAHLEFSRGWFYREILPFLNTTITLQAVPDTPTSVHHSEL